MTFIIEQDGEDWWVLSNRDTTVGPGVYVKFCRTASWDAADEIKQALKGPKDQLFGGELKPVHEVPVDGTWEILQQTTHGYRCGAPVWSRYTGHHILARSGPLNTMVVVRPRVA